MNNIIRTERGWAGHFILSERCLFRRNTLLQYNSLNLVISTVGNCMDIHSEGFPNKITIRNVGINRYFETMVFHAKPDDPFMDADVSQEVSFNCDWSIDEPWKEAEANQMHEQIVNEITTLLLERHIKAPEYATF